MKSKPDDIENILLQGEKIYPLSEESDKKCDEICSVSNWAEIFYNVKKTKMKEKFMKLISISENKQFFLGLDYEYGINGKKKDIKNAFSIYSQAANVTTDTLSMYRLYHIYKKDFKKFGLPKRNRVMERFYLLKCFAYLEGEELDHSRNLFNRFDIVREIATQLSIEDNDLTKFKSFIAYLKQYFSQLKINFQDIIIIEATLLLKFTVDYENDRDFNVTDYFRGDIIKSNLEAIFKIAVFLSLSKNPKAEEYFKILFVKKYYRSYSDYALFLYNVKKDISKALEISKLGYKNGVMSAGNIYYDIYLNTCDLEKFAKDNSERSMLKEIFDILIDLMAYDEMYRFFEFFFLRRICVKHFGQKDYLDKLYFDFIKEIVEYVQEITKGEDGNKEEIVKYYLREDFYCEFNLVMGEIYYYGIEGLIPKDIEKSLEKLKIPYKKSDSVTYKRFAYAYICTIRKKLFEEGKKDITLEKVKKSNKKLFDYYLTSITKIEEFTHLSSSYCYFMSKMYNLEYGGKGDLLMEYIFLKKACDRELDNPGYGSIVAVYRKYKALKKMEKEEKTRFKGVLDTVESKDDNEGYGEDNSICPICLDKKRDHIILPCKHLFCGTCLKLIFEKKKCPICRGLILFTVKLNQ